MLDRIHWLGNTAFWLQGPPHIYLNPSCGLRATLPSADLILVTRATYENCSPRVLETLCGPSTVIVANTAAADCLSGHDVRVLRPWQSTSMGRARITAIPPHPTRSARLPADELPAVAYLISEDLYDIYYAGETVILPDTMAFRPDIAILPVRNARTGLLDLDYVVEAVRILRPRWVIPSHWADNGRGYLELKAFEAALSGSAEIVIPVTAG